MDQNFGELYIEIAAGIMKFIPGYSRDAYGPVALAIRERVKQKEVTTEDLLSQIEDLKNLLDEEDKIRRDFLKKEMTAMETTIRKLHGEEFDYRDEVKRLYDIEPTKMPEKEIYSIHEELGEIFGSSDVKKSVDVWRSSNTITPEKMESILSILKQEFTKRSYKLLPIPEKEEMKFELIKNVPYQGLSVYSGSFKTTVRISMDAPHQITSLPGLVAHEAYPGHHVHNCLIEKYLFDEKKFVEVSTPLSQSPRRVVSNSLGNLGVDILYDNPNDLYVWLAKEYGIVMSERDLKINGLLNKLKGTRKNITLMLHEENKTEEEAFKYLVDLGLFNVELAKSRLRFATKELYRAHIFCYFDNTLKNNLPKIKKNLLKMYISQFSISQFDDVFP